MCTGLFMTTQLEQEEKSVSVPDEALADRRPLNSRNTRAARSAARYLANTAITPNQISAASIVAAVIACMFLMVSVHLTGWWLSLCYVAAAIACQLRLVCNLMDGMVAIEAGKQTADGAVWNELPDRIADMAILVGVGFAVAWPSLGWAVAALAVLVSYVRELGKGIDGVVDFSGPMAKPHRMALVTGMTILAALVNVLPIGSTQGNVEGNTESSAAVAVLHAGLWVVAIACVITVYRRTRSLLDRLQP